MEKKDNWYGDFFTGLSLDFWVKLMDPEVTGKEADFIEQSLGLKPGARLLDVPCGGGRLSIELTKRGFVLTGVDLSDGFLELARQTSSGLGLDVSWLKSDMRVLPASGDFDAAFCFGNSFGYFDANGTLDFLKAVSGALRPGGRFIIDTGVVAELLLPELVESFWMRLGDITMLIANTYHAGESLLETDYTFIRGGQEERRKCFQWVFTAGEVRRLLETAGMKTVDIFGSLDGEPFSLASHRFLIAAEKTA